MDLSSLDMYAGIPVRDRDVARVWYSRLLDAEPFLPNDTEAVWDLAEHRAVFVEEAPHVAGSALLSLFVADLDGVVADIATRGIAPDHVETYDNGVRKVTFVDPDGNRIGFGGGPRSAD